METSKTLIVEDAGAEPDVVLVEVKKLLAK